MVVDAVKQLFSPREQELEVVSNPLHEGKVDMVGNPLYGSTKKGLSGRVTYIGPEVVSALFEKISPIKSPTAVMKPRNEEYDRKMLDLSAKINEFITNSTQSISGNSYNASCVKPFPIMNVRQADGSMRETIKIESVGGCLWVQKDSEGKMITLDVTPIGEKHLFKGGYKEIFISHHCKVTINIKNGKQEVFFAEHVVAKTTSKNSENLNSVRNGMAIHDYFYKKVDEEKQIYIASPFDVLEDGNEKIVATMPKYACDFGTLLHKPNILGVAIQASDFIKMFVDLGNILIDLHALWHSHLDLKSNNILVGYDPDDNSFKVKLHDFDLSKTNYSVFPFLQEQKRSFDDSFFKNYGLVTPFQDCFALFYMIDRHFFQGLCMITYQASLITGRQKKTEEWFDVLVGGKIKAFLAKYPSDHVIHTFSISYKNGTLSVPDEDSDLLDQEIINKLKKEIECYRKLFELLAEVAKCDMEHVQYYNYNFLYGVCQSVAGGNYSDQNLLSFDECLKSQERILVGKLDLLQYDFIVAGL